MASSELHYNRCFCVAFRRTCLRIFFIALLFILRFQTLIFYAKCQNFRTFFVNNFFPCTKCNLMKAYGILKNCFMLMMVKRKKSNWLQGESKVVTLLMLFHLIWCRKVEKLLWTTVIHSLNQNALNLKFK